LNAVLIIIATLKLTTSAMQNNFLAEQKKFERVRTALKEKGKTTTVKRTL
jgi:hypothetical protein